MHLIRLTALLLITALLTAKCEKHYNYYYRVIGVACFNADNSGEAPEISEADSLAANSYAISLIDTMLFISNDGDANDNYDRDYSNLFTLNEFTVRALENFDSTHPAGTSLNDCFLYMSNKKYSSQNLLDNLAGTQWLGSSPGYNLSNPETWTGSKSIVLMKQPETGGIYHFVIKIEDGGGLSVTDTTTVRLFL